VATFFISTASDPAAVSLYDVLRSAGFDVYDETLAEAASLVVFNAQKKKLLRAIRDAKTDGVLESPHSIRIVEVKVASAKPLFRKGSEEVMHSRYGVPY